MVSQEPDKNRAGVGKVESERAFREKTVHSAVTLSRMGCLFPEFVLKARGGAGALPS